MALRRFIIERDIPKVGTFEREQLRAGAAKSNEALRHLGPDIQWVNSFLAADKTFCVYLGQGRGHHSQACGDERLSRHDHHRDPHPHRSDHRTRRIDCEASDEEAANEERAALAGSPSVVEPWPG